METSIGLCFDDFVMVATDQNSKQSILLMKDDSDKTYTLSDNLLISAIGESGDTTQFAEFIAKNIQLYKMRNGYEMSPSAAANFTRRNLADYLRSRTPFAVHLLIAGYDKKNKKPELYSMDYLACMVKVPYTSHGYGGIFTNGILDCHFDSKMNVDQAYNLMKDCVAEIQKRLIINHPQFNVKVIDANGIKDLPAIGYKPVNGA